MDPLEIAAVALGVVNVALVVKRSIWNFPVALVMVTLYAIVFWDARLYSDVLLQGFFLAVNLYGWIGWRRAQADLGGVAVETMTPRSRIGWSVGWAVAAVAWGAAMHRFTDAAVPWWDAGNAAASVVAQLLLARRKLENWTVWIMVDVSSVALYATKGLALTAVLYGVFLAMSVWGLVDWRRALTKAAQR